MIDIQEQDFKTLKIFKKDIQEQDIQKQAQDFNKMFKKHMFY